MDYLNLRKVIFWGYSKESVHKTISDFKLENQRLKDKIKNQDSVIETLKEKISRYESKDVLVSEVLVEAKHVAKNMIKDAHDEVETLRNDSEKELSEKISLYDNTMSKLESIRSDMITKEVQLREELKSVINTYLEYVENIDLSAFSDLVNETDTQLKSVALTKEKLQVEKIDSSEKNNIVEIHTKYKDDIVSLTDIPTYDFNEIMP